MSNYVHYYNTRQAMYLDMAVRWKRWSDTANVSESERRGIAAFFKSIAKRFGLVQKFKEIGVIS